MKLGFIGLGHMGVPMARNLARAGADLLVWNRSPGKAGALAEASTAADVFGAAEVVILMLANSGAIDAVLARDSPAFSQRVRGHTIVNMGTTSPAYSRALEADIVGAGGVYVEAPVSGSRVPAEQGSLVGMLAGDGAALARVKPLLQPMCAEQFECGAVPQALLMKLSVNLFLITMVTSLLEATHFARTVGADELLFRAIIEAGPMRSSVASSKLAKVIERDWSVQAAVSDVRMNAQLIADAAHQHAIGAPLLERCHALLLRTEALGHGGADMAAVIHAFL